MLGLLSISMRPYQSAKPRSFPRRSAENLNSRCTELAYDHSLCGYYITFRFVFQPRFRAFFSGGKIGKRGKAARPDRAKPPVTCAPVCGRAIRGAAFPRTGARMLAIVQSARAAVFFQRKRARICILDVLHIKESAAFPRAGVRMCLSGGRVVNSAARVPEQPFARARLALRVKIYCSPADALAIRAAGRQSLSRAGRPCCVHQTNIPAPKIARGRTTGAHHART